MSCWAIIPIKASADAKSRLAPALSPDERRELARAMLAHVVGAAQTASAIDRVLLVGPSREGLDESIPLLADPDEGLNPAVQSALAEVSGEGITRVVVVAADLPIVTPQELSLMAVAPDATVAIAPDRHETGTNAISLPLPEGAAFQFAFGPDSFAKHQAEARRLGLEVETVLGHGLERDIDEPGDLPDAAEALGRTD